MLRAAFALIMFLPGFFTLPPFDRDDARFAHATRQMIESDDFIDIRFQDTSRCKRPIGVYWLQAASVTT
jgi:4-amino-4-deoxy-L-arabinose transferase-like glycosyltransferase